MVSRFTLPHIDISPFFETAAYAGTGSGRPPGSRIRDEHGARLARDLSVALSGIDELRSSEAPLDRSSGSYVEVELRRGANPSEVLERKSNGIRPGAVKDQDNARTVALFIPDQARPALQQVIADYLGGPLTQGGNPPNAARVEAIEAFRRVRLESFWTDDPEALPEDPNHEMWWAVWVHKDKEEEFEGVCNRLDVRAAPVDKRMYFPEAAVIPVLARRSAIELMTYVAGVVDELRRATDNPSFFTEAVRETQHEWSEDLASRTIWPGADVPAVCLLDTGVNRAHALLEPALANTDLYSVDPGWGTDDHHEFGHGTPMAGLALHGDLTAKLADTSEHRLSHRLESVKLVPPDELDPNDPNSYGVITQSAVSLPAIAQPERRRVYCMAVTNDNVAGSTPSAWSAAIDQAAAATMIADDEEAPKRLFVLAAGNIPAHIAFDRIQPQDNYPAEDPCQAWNAITVGACTDLTTIGEPDYGDWTVLADAGTSSPHSRNSVGWAHSRAPIKPEIVLEGGNRALSPSRTEVLTLDSLSLLSTGKDVTSQPLVPFDATSAATAQAARMAAQLSAEFEDYWPETIRALMIHSAEWTQPMISAFKACSGRRDRYDVARRYGYGVPDFDRARASARDHLAIIAQNEIQPFRLQGQRKFNECHYYNLPLPISVLEQLNNEIVQLKVTLSYFIDPNPGFSANVDPFRYQSFGLRFDLKRRSETLQRFKERVNSAEREDGRSATASPDDENWMLGSNSVSSGSLHCDVWTGPAINLLGRNTLCVKPVMGWWRSRGSPEVVNRSSRYALIITLKGPNTDIDLYTPIQSLIETTPVSIDTSV